MVTEIFSLPASTSLLAEVNTVGEPDRNRAQDGTIGDPAHMEHASDHNLDEIGNTGSSSDSDSIREVHARDIDSRGPWRAGWTMERIVQIILGRCRSGAEKRLKYVIYNGRIWEASNSWRQRTYTGADQHREHAHFSLRYGSGSGTSNPENITSPWGIRAAFEQEDDMSAEDVNKIMSSISALSAKIDATNVTKRWGPNGGPISKDDPNQAPTMAFSSTGYYIGGAVYQVRNTVTALAAAVSKVLANVTSDDGEAQQIIAEVRAAQDATVSDVLAGLTESGRSDEDVAAALRAALGDRASGVGALLAGQ